MNQRSNIALILILGIVIISAVVGFFLWQQYEEKQEALKKAEKPIATAENTAPQPFTPSMASRSPLQAELEELTQQTIANIKEEQRLNLNMTAQLRVYETMLTQLQDYSKKIETDINLVKEISKDDFQENVALQAILFTGKKPDLVARHLEEFDPLRVGAILSKMKEKEASQVLDVWAIASPILPNYPNFYKDVMTAYLANRRRDMHPDLFDSELNAKATANSGSATNPAANPATVANPQSATPP